MRTWEQTRGTDRGGGPGGQRRAREAATTINGNDNSDVTTGGHLIIGTTSNIDTLNPFVTFQQNSYAAFEYIYPQLVQFDSQTFELMPDFAHGVDDVRRRADVDVPHRAEREVVRRPAADRERCRLDVQHDPEVRRRSGRQPRRRRSRT